MPEETKTKRMICNSCSESLIEALENVEEMESVLIIYQNKKDSPDAGGYFVDKNVTLADCIYFLEKMKQHILHYEFGV